MASVGSNLRRLADSAGFARPHSATNLSFREFPFGGNAIDRSARRCLRRLWRDGRASDCDPTGRDRRAEVESLPFGTRPEAGLLGIRKETRPVHQRARFACARLFAQSLRFVPKGSENVISKLCASWPETSTFGEPRITKEKARRPCGVFRFRNRACGRYSFERAAARNGHLTSVDKANVLAVPTLWRDTVTALAREYPGVRLDHLYVDNAAMQILLRPSQFDVILTGNMFGDILSDKQRRWPVPSA